MTKKIYYEKIGRKYVPVREYDSNLMDALPKGSHLIVCYPGGQSTRYNVEPNYAALIAAGRIAEDTISSILRKASDLRPKKMPITQEQKDAWENLVRVFGEEARLLEWPSAREAAEEAVKAMEEEAFRLMLHPAVKKSYENFQIVCKLVNDVER